jgi:RNA polymerase sigma-70 factor, ECF subfamily
MSGQSIIKCCFQGLLTCFVFTLLIILRLYLKAREELTDQELIEECRKGNLKNFRILVERTSPYAFSVAFRMLGDEDQAKDVVQETMIVLWKKIGKIKSTDSFKSWLYRIVSNKCYDQMRKNKSNPEKRADDNDWTLLSNIISSVQHSELENKEIAQVINLLTGKLSINQKRVFILCDIEGMTHDEVASATGMNTVNIKANLYYARKRIREMIVKYL